MFTDLEVLSLEKQGWRNSDDDSKHKKGRGWLLTTPGVIAVVDWLILLFIYNYTFIQGNQ